MNLGGGKTSEPQPEEAADGAADHEASAVLDESACDDSAAYRIKFSKWNQGSFDAIQCPIFWFLVGICRVIRSPLRHFMLYVQKQAAECAGECVLRLVTGKLDDFNRDFETVFENLPNLVETALEISGCMKLAEVDINRLKMVTRKLLLQSWSAFRRRVVKPLSQ